MLDYAALASQCRTKNEFNRLHIDLENTLAPAEFLEIKKLAATQSLAAPSRSWLDSLEKLSPDLFQAPQAYQRHVLSPQVTLYQDHASDIANKSLLVAFSGNARRLMLPVGVFLQFVDSRRWDVVVLRKNGKSSFLRGLEGVSSNFQGVIRHVQRAVSVTRYRRTITLGTSGGGSAAIMAALLMGADRGVSICGSTPKSRPGIWLQWRLASCQRKATSSGLELWYAYGAECPQDRRQSGALLNIFGGRLVPVEGVDVHNLLGKLLERGQFAEFIAELIE